MPTRKENEQIMGITDVSGYKLLKEEAEDLIMHINIRIQYCVHIYMHQILKILVIAAGHRIHRLIRISHRI